MDLGVSAMSSASAQRVFLYCKSVPEPGSGNIQAVVDRYRDTSNPMWLRDRGTIAGWLDSPGWELLTPGIFHPPDWRPAPGTRLDAEQEDARPYMWAGVTSRT
jgi:hypothetical protein